jgi:hypothetical protein
MAPFSEPDFAGIKASQEEEALCNAFTSSFPQ